ncbi:DUF4181 domain-containing protein [Oceanobacillus halophilus]|uniref:DUF4181 domain-containing protein n=1 Tax=Oceanobacillus halophilus TaxID=930130 RepID=A0A495A1T0_9BACI|nr:DUF4181 domain-containing protein [Oceanobacillus halophilus]RKQ33235.1 DUF4181 domain-containing protein [Oceanobacillus halophilus]
MIWINFIMIVLITFVLIAAVRIILRKAFNIEKMKKETFSYNHINGLHKKIDWAIRIITAIVLIICLYLITYQSFSINISLIALIITSGTAYAIRAFFEWRYTENPKHSIITASEMFIVVLTLFTIIQFDLLVT